MARLELSLTATVSAFASAAIDPAGPREMALLGARGDGKSVGVLATMIAHATEHKRRGGTWPTIWMGATDTHESHKRKTVRTLQAPLWAGCWRIADQAHEATFRLNDESPMVKIDLFGINDQAAMNKVRAECHGVWFEEPAPAGGDVESSGVSEDSWSLAITSMRLPSYRHPALMSLNYPDEDHWTWQRFVDEGNRLKGTAYWRIPPGERSTPEERAAWAEALRNRPDLARRLLQGEPGHVQLGPEVAQGYNAITHVAKQRLEILPGELWMGHDSSGSSHHHATIVGQRYGRMVRIYAGLVSEGTGWRQHLEQVVWPWLEKRCPRILDHGHEALLHRYDPAMDTDEGGDIDLNPVKRGRRALGGTWQPGAVSWAGRAGPMLAVFNMGEAGRPSLEICPGPDTAMLRKALNGRWHYKQLPNGTIAKDLPHKPNHPWEDLGDAFCYLIGGMAPSREVKRAPPRPIRKDFDVFNYERSRIPRRDPVPLIGANVKPKAAL